MTFYKVGSNQYKRIPQTHITTRYTRRKRIRPGGLIGAWLVIGITGFTLFHYTTIGIQVGTKITKAWAAETFITTATAPTHIVSPLSEKTYAAGITPKPTTAPTYSDLRVQKVADYLLAKDSPLAPYAELIVSEADTQDISWTLIVAISGKESSFGTMIKPESHNAWGIMAWDSQGKRYVRSFSSWEEGIKFESKLISQNFRKDSNAGIQSRYCPISECSSTWTEHVTSFQEQIN